MTDFAPRDGDVLLIVDVQVDFTSGALAVPGAQAIVPIINEYAAAFADRGLPVVATRDWHPRNHLSFVSEGGPWPAHCIAGTNGARFHPSLALPPMTRLISKAMHADSEAYSAFEGTPLDALLHQLHARRLFACGLATDFCVLATVQDALRLRYAVVLLTDAMRAVERQPGDGERAIHAMLLAGAQAATLEAVTGEAPAWA